MTIRKKGVARALVVVSITLFLLGLLGAPALGGVDPRDGRVVGDNGRVVIGETNVRFINQTGQIISAGIIQCTGGDVTTNIFFEGPFDTSNYKDALALGSCQIFGPSDVIDVFFLPPELTVTTEVNDVDFEWVTRGGEITFKRVTNLQVIEDSLPYNYVTFKLLDPRNVRLNEVNGVPLTDIDVSGGAIGFVTIDTTTMKTGRYTLSIETDPDSNNGLDEEGPQVSFAVRSKGVTIEADEEEQTVTKDIAFTVSTTPYTEYQLEVTWGPPANVKFEGVALPLIGTTEKDGEVTVVATFTKTGSYEITATEAIMGTTDSIFVEIVPYDTELKVDKDPAVYHIGEKVEIDVSATAGDSITLKIEDEVVDTGLDIEGDKYSWNTENLVPGSYEISIWVLPFSDPETDPPDASITVILIRGGLFAQPSASFVVPGDKFIISGTVPGRDFVDILTISPDGGGGRGLDPLDISEDTAGKLDAPGLTYETTGVDTDGEFETEKIAVNRDVDLGTYTIIALNYGRDGEWGISRESNFLKAISNDYTTPLGVKSTDQILAIVKDRTIDAPGTDDLLGLSTIDVESGFVTIDELADVPLGGEITVTGTTNRQVDTSITITVEGTDERTPDLKPKIAKVKANDKIYYNSFEATFPTESANIGEYIVTVDDSDRHTASTSLTIVPAVEPAVNVSAPRPSPSGGAEVNESVAETPVPTPTTQPTNPPTEPPVMESTAMPGFLSLWIILMILWFVIAIIIAVWVYRDATEHGQNGMLWMIIVLLLSVVGLLVWLVKRPKTKE
jgi:acylphosphatase